MSKRGPPKKQKTSKATKKDIENVGSKQKPAQKDDAEVKDKQKTKTKAKNDKQESANGKPPAEEPAAAEAEKKITGGAERDSKESRYIESSSFISI